jgi:uncharacterized protein
MVIRIQFVKGLDETHITIGSLILHMHAASLSRLKRSRGLSQNSCLHRAIRWTATSTTNPPHRPTAAASFCIGALAGTLGSLAGLGGGFVMIPLMTSVLRLSQHMAHGTSLFAVSATGLAGAVSYGDAVHWPSALAVTTTALVTARMGARATTTFSETALKRAFGYLMLLMAPAVPAKAYFMTQHQQHLSSSPNANDDDTSIVHPATTVTTAIASEWLYTLIPALGAGLVSGYLSGLFGVGGGVIVVPAVTVSCPDLSHQQALATSLAAMCLPALLGTWTHYQAGHCALTVAPYLALGALTGAYLGGQVALQSNENVLQWGFCGLLTFLGIQTLLKAR